MKEIKRDERRDRRREERKGERSIIKSEGKENEIGLKKRKK